MDARALLLQASLVFFSKLHVQKLKKVIRPNYFKKMITLVSINLRAKYVLCSNFGDGFLFNIGTIR